MGPKAQAPDNISAMSYQATSSQYPPAVSPDQYAQPQQPPPNYPSQPQIDPSAPSSGEHLNQTQHPGHPQDYGIPLVSLNAQSCPSVCPHCGHQPPPNYPNQPQMDPSAPSGGVPLNQTQHPCHPQNHGIPLVSLNAQSCRAACPNCSHHEMTAVSYKSGGCIQYIFLICALLPFIFAPAVIIFVVVHMLSPEPQT